MRRDIRRLNFKSSNNIIMNVIKKIIMGAALLLAASTISAQENADISKMGHFKLRSYLKENGLKTSTGKTVKVGDELVLGKGTLPDKRFAFIYQAPTSAVSQSSLDMNNKAYLNSSAVGRKAVVKAFMTSGMKKGNYSIYVVVGVSEPVNYWIELESAIEAGEIIIQD